MSVKESQELSFKDKDCSQQFRLAYENRYTWDSDFPGYKGSCSFNNGKEVFKNAVKRFPEVIVEGLEHNKLRIEDLDILIPHQANLRISKFIQKKLNLSNNQIFSNIHKYGNTPAASIPIAFSEALAQNKISKGDIIALASFGSGFTWGSCIIKWVE